MSAYDDHYDLAPEREQFQLFDERAAFISRTYSHVMGAIAAFVGIEVALFTTGIAETIMGMFVAGGQMGWLVAMGLFVVVGWMASKIAMSSISTGAQYAALTAYVVVEALIFVPLLYIANQVAPGVIGSAGVITLLSFAGLTAIAFITRKDFSFLRGVLMFAGVLAIVAIVGSVIFGFELGVWFSVAMVGVAGASILYDTSNIIRHYPTDRHVAAALSLFASVALMFYYMVRLLMQLQRD